MNTNNTNRKTDKLLYPELSYSVTGICFDVHNERGRFAREVQYCDTLEQKLMEKAIQHEREKVIGTTGNKADFIVAGKIILEIKAKKFILKEDYYQLQRYLQATNLKLGLLINFRSRYLKPIRVVLIETDVKLKYQ